MKNSRILFLFTTILLLFWLAISNSLIVFFVNAEPTREIEWYDFNKKSKDPVYAYIDDVVTTNQTLEISSFDSWAFVETEFSNSDRYISYIFQNASHCYELRDTYSSFLRLDVLRAYPSKKIPSPFLGGHNSFCHIKMKEGIYDVYIFCYENEINYGLTQMPFQVIKKDGTIQLISSQDSLPTANFFSPTSEILVTECIDNIYISDGLLKIDGWCFIENLSSDQQNVYLQFINEDGVSLQIPANSHKRDDVSDFFAISSIDECGFSANLQKDELIEGNWVMRILIENQNQFYASKSYGINKTNESISILTDLPFDFDENKSIAIEAAPSYLDKIISVITIPLNALMKLCYSVTNSYVLAIIVFTLLTKIILFPVSMWVQKNGITMVKITPELNRIKIKYFGDKDSIDDETQSLYKREKYNPLSSTIPLIVQLVLLFGVIAAVKELMGGANSVLTIIPKEAGGITYLMPLGAGVAALALGLCQNHLNPLQREQGKKEQWFTNGVSIGISLFLGAFVSLGVGIYWIASNLFSIVQQILLNIVIKPEKYIDYNELENSRIELAKLDSLNDSVSEEDKKRERADYKRFFSVANKHLVIYSEKSGFYKYFKDVIDFILKYSNVIVHYVTNDPDDQIFRIAENQPRIKPYYISEKKLITLMMKMDADIVVMTCPDLDRFHIKRSYVRKDIEYIYMFHYPLSTHMVLNTGALDNYDTILCVGDFQFEEIRAAEKLYNLPEKKLISAGYGQLEQLYNSYCSMEAVVRSKPKILIAPSWQQDNILDSCIDKLLEQLLGKEYEIVIRPHPEYVKRYKSRMDNIVQRYSNFDTKELSFELDFTSNNSLFDSDILITDWSGSAYEFSLVTLKPSVFINTPPKINNPDYIKLNVEPLEFKLRSEVGIQVEPENIDGLSNKIDELLKSVNLYAEKNKQIREKYIANFGKSGEVGGKYILSQLLARQSKNKK